MFEWVRFAQAHMLHWYRKKRVVFSYTEPSIRSCMTLKASLSEKYNGCVPPPCKKMVTQTGLPAHKKVVTSALKKHVRAHMFTPRPFFVQPYIDQNIKATF